MERYGSGRVFARHFKDLHVYQLSFGAAMRLFKLTQCWPKEEMYSLTSQIRRSSRGVCGCISEAWAKRRYPNHFISKLTDADGEVAETQNWLDFALECGYIERVDYDELWSNYRQVTAGLVKMMNEADDWCGPSVLRDGAGVDYDAAPGPE